MSQFVPVDGKKMYTYILGEGDITCILLSGSAIVSPTWEYMPLVKDMGQYCKMIVIEKFGYGYSDLAETPREIDTVIDEYRCVHQSLGINKPVVLIAHSMGYLEALRWTQRFPNEVRGIIGLDPATPNAYKDFSVEKQTKTLTFLAKMEAFKKMLAQATLKRLLKQRNCTEADKKLLRELAAPKVLNPVWISEAKYLRQNIDTISNGETIQLPILFFVSNGKGTSQAKETWRNHALSYLSSLKNAQYELVEYPHNLYEYIPQEIACISKEFITSLAGSHLLHKR
ncbi:MAG: alpha/beta fold hydrolase [Cellulosilyticaceae bacterium]